MRVLKVFLSVILMCFISSCSAKVRSPMISTINQSDNYVNNIQIIWNNYILGAVASPRSPGQGFSQNFWLKNKSDLYGPVRIEWENAEGKKIVKEFNFKEEDLPNFQNNQKPTKKFGRTTFDNIYFFLTQEDMKMIVDPNGVGSDEIKREQKIANRFSDDFIKICPKHYGCDLSKRNQK